MRVMVTGAQGFVGRHLVQRWLAADPDARVLGVGRSVRREGFTHAAGRATEAPLPGGFEDHGDRYAYCRGDVSERARLCELLLGFRPDVVIHLATVLRDGDPARLLQTNASGTAALLDAVAGSGVEARVVLGSTGAVYGRPQALPLAEDTPWGPPVNAYAVSRRAAEEVADVLAAAHGLSLCVARLFNPVGPGLHERHLPAWLARQVAEIAAGRGEPVIEVGPLDTTRDFVDVRDVADAIRAIALQDAPGVWNIASGRETPTQAILDGLVRAAGLQGRVEIRRQPRRPADVPRHVASVDKLCALVPPRFTLDDALGELLAWYRDDVARAAEGPGPGQGAPLAVSAPSRRTYDVEIRDGLLDALPARLATRFPGASVAVLTDARVDELYGERVRAGLASAGVAANCIVLPPGEQSKAFDPYQRVIRRLHAAGFERRSVLVCLGGGMVTDTGGFVAATYMRGVPYVNVPTTLLAQHDSAVGGKVAINTPWAKNFVGAFHHPAAVYCDPSVLTTLARADLAAGVAEAIKVALTGDAALFALLEEHATALLEDRDIALLGRVVRGATRRKIDLLDPDPYETALRRALNLGHTLAHPLETEMEYSGLRHGEAVAYGIALATEVARGRGVCPTGVADRILRLLAAYDLPPPIPRERQEAALARLREIRMVRGGHLHFVMPVDVDAVRIVPDVDPGELRGAMDRLGQRLEPGGPCF